VLSLSPAVRIHLAVAPTDMRKGIDGLLGLVAAGTRADPYSGHLFVFLSRRRDQARILFWDRGGFVLYWYPLHKPSYSRPPADRTLRACQSKRPGSGASPSGARVV
jgi:transposase